MAKKQTHFMHIHTGSVFTQDEYADLMFKDYKLQCELEDADQGLMAFMETWKPHFKQVKKVSGEWVEA